MTNRLKYLGLSIGILMVFLSFLFFDRRQDDYLMLLMTGLFFSSFFYLAILTGKHSKRTRLSWTLVIFISAGLQWLAEPILIDCSYKLFIFENGAFVAHSPGTIMMLGNKPNGIYVSRDTIVDHSKTLSNNDRTILDYKIGKLDGINVVIREDKYICFVFKGTRHGLLYWTDKSKPDIHYRHLSGNWYR
jgi:hypothetical protein